MSIVSVCQHMCFLLQYGYTALMKAAQRGNLEMVQKLLTAQAILDLKSKVM